MQPTFIPWCGYFALLSAVDVFVFLDDVQLTRPSWQTRNRVLDRQGVVRWLSLDVARSHGTPLPAIRDAVLDDTHRWREKHLRSVSLNYAKAPYVDEVLDLLESTMSSDVGTVGDLNRGIIQAASTVLSIPTPTMTSSDLGRPGLREERLVALCTAVSGRTYVSTPGSAVYLETDEARRLFADEGILVEYQDFVCREYDQGSSAAFVPQLSLVDHLAWLGARGMNAHLAEGGRHHFSGASRDEESGD